MADTFPMEHQEETDWCWNAVAVSVEHYFHPHSQLTQRSFAVKALNYTGHLHAIFPSNASLNLSAMANEGRIANGFGDKKTGPADVIHSVAEVIGPNAQAVVSLEARRGNIRIDKILD